MAADIVTDLSIRKNWNVAVGFNNTFTFNFISSGAYDISGYTFSLQIRSFNSSSNVVNLTQGSGLTNGGATGILTAVLSSAQSALLTGGEYFWQLTVVHPDTLSYRWFNGTLRAYKEVYFGDTVSNVTSNVTINGTQVSVSLTIGGIGSTTLASIGGTLETASADTPLDADTFHFYDAVDTVLKKITWANIKATLKTYFDTIYTTTSAVATQISTALSGYLTSATAASTYETISNVALKQNLIITETVLVDADTIDIAAQNNTLATSRTAITLTISSTATFNTVTITLTGTSLVLTLPANSLCFDSDGTASGDNTCTLTGVSGDVYELVTKKRGATYSVIAKNIGQ